MIPTPADPVGTLVFFIAVFAAVGIFFLFIHLVMGWFIRPSIPDAEKLTIYECGEPTVGSAWIQFDLRFYVVALLFVIFDVEVAFFFPWATVFGKANQLAHMPPVPNVQLADGNPKTLTDAEKAVETERMRLTEQLHPVGQTGSTQPIDPASASAWAKIAFFDILVFFGVLMVGFAYVWRRGDIDWVRAYQHHQEPPTPAEKPLEQQKVA